MSLLLFENEKCVNILSCLDLKLQMSFNVKNAKLQKQNKIPQFKKSKKKNPLFIQPWWLGSLERPVIILVICEQWFESCSGHKYAPAILDIFLWCT